MKRLTALGVLQLVLSTVLVIGFALQLRAEPAQRIVSAGGSVTEIVFALGQQHRLIARDTTSVYPAKARELPDVGYVRRLSPEGLLSVNPDLILAEEGAGPPETMELMRETQIPIVTIPTGYDRMAVLAKIAAVAEALGVAEEGAALAARVGDEIDRAVPGRMNGMKVLFVLTMRDGRIMASGDNTAASGIISLAGAENAVKGFDGYKPLSDEAILTAEPDVILVMDNRRTEDMSDEALLAHPGLAATPAGRNGAILRMDGLLLLGFSVRTGQAVTELAHGLDKFGS